MCFHFTKTIQEQPDKRDCADDSNVLTNFPPSLNAHVRIKKSKHHYLDLKGWWETLRAEKRPCTLRTAVPRPGELPHSLNQTALMQTRPRHIGDGCHSEHFAEILRCPHFSLRGSQHACIVKWIFNCPGSTNRAAMQSCSVMHKYMQIVFLCD